MDGKVLFRDGQNLFIGGKYKESIEAFKKAEDAGEKTEILYLSRGVANVKLNEHDKAIEDFSRAIDLNSQNSRSYYYCGLAYLIKEDFDKAVTNLGRAIELKPDHGAAFFARGTAYAQMGNDDEAAKNIKTALTYSEAAAQGFADTVGIFRTQFDKALALLTGERKAPSVALTEEETETLKKWIKE
jgi:tetratricopeptide (TPR) repeat protein